MDRIYDTIGADIPVGIASGVPIAIVKVVVSSPGGAIVESFRIILSISYLGQLIAIIALGQVVFLYTVKSALQLFYIAVFIILGYRFAVGVPNYSLAIGKAVQPFAPLKPEDKNIVFRLIDTILTKQRFKTSSSRI